MLWLKKLFCRHDAGFYNPLFPMMGLAPFKVCYKCGKEFPDMSSSAGVLDPEKFKAAKRSKPLAT